MAFAIAGLSTAATIALVGAGTAAAVSGAQAIGSNQRRKSRERELDEYAKQSPLYQGSKPISEYYQQAMNRYNENPYQSQQYQVGAMNARRATAQGLGALQDRRSAIGGISRLEAGQNAAMQNLGAQAEAQRNQRFGQLGNATQMKNADLMQQFDINKMTPYNRMLALKQMKSQAANEEYSRDVNNTFNALGNMASLGVSAGQNVKVPPTIGPSSKETFDSWMSDPSLRPQINNSFISKAPSLSRYNPRISGASIYFPNAD